MRLLQQAFREPSPPVPGASDKDGTVSPEAFFIDCPCQIIPAKTFPGACFALQSWFKYSYSRYYPWRRKPIVLIAINCLLRKALQRFLLEDAFAPPR